MIASGDFHLLFWSRKLRGHSPITSQNLEAAIRDGLFSRFAMGQQTLRKLVGQGGKSENPDNM